VRVIESRSRVRVRYAETDQMGIAWHGNYFAWFEVGRTDLLRQFGTTYREMEALGLRLPIIDCSAQYRRPARYDDELEILTRLRKLGGARLEFEYEVRAGGTDGLLATGHTTHASTDPSGRPRRLPDELRRRLR
jgi:acyl-CoA thioester hydrolase